MFAGCWPTEGALSAATGHQANLSLPRNQVLGFRGLATFLAVQDSSISDIVCLSVGQSVGLSQLTIRA